MRRIVVLAGVMMLVTSSLVVAAASLAGGVDGGDIATFLDPGANGTAKYVVPDGVCQVQIYAVGAKGGDGSSTNGAGALGGSATATIAVTPGETLSVFVGGKGGNVSSAGAVPGAGGTNGGGNGGDSIETGTQSGGGGGGGSDVRQGGTALANRIVVGGGGGGGGGASTNDTRGGKGGGTNGEDGHQQDTEQSSNFGKGGTQGAGGAGGVGQDFDGTTNLAFSGQNGSPGVGGAGANSTGMGSAGAGGGGGGGWNGGGGAAARDFRSSAGGGGGSGFTPTGTQLVTGVDAVNSGNGHVEIDPAVKGIGCPSQLEVAKVVSGTSTQGFTVHVTCLAERTLVKTVDVDLPFANNGAAVSSQTPPGWVAFNQLWHLEKQLVGNTCTATETATGGASSVSYACTWTAGVQDNVAGVGCPGGSSGPSASPASVKFEGDADLGKLTVTNTFLPPTPGGTTTTTTTALVPLKFTG